MRISDWSSDVCSSDLVERHPFGAEPREDMIGRGAGAGVADDREFLAADAGDERSFGHRRAQHAREAARSEEHTSELQSLMRISYAVFCLKKKIKLYQMTTYSL